MKKFILLVLIAFLLCGCMKVDNISQTVNDVVNLINSEDIDIHTNNTKKYYEYYLPYGVSNLESEKTYNILEIKNTRLILNLNIDKIINNKYYPSEINDIYEYNFDKPVFSLNNGNIKNEKFSLNIYKMNDDYFILLEIINIRFISLIKLNNLEEILYNMFIIGLSTKTDDEMIINDFSSKDVVDYYKENVDLFGVIVPKDGRLEELIKPN